ncbi:hypothetical protein TMatcc_004910 [Talaromyces marneffei ATCC 18224]
MEFKGRANIRQQRSYHFLETNRAGQLKSQFGDRHADQETRYSRSISCIIDSLVPTYRAHLDTWGLTSHIR